MYSDFFAVSGVAEVVARFDVEIGGRNLTRILSPTWQIRGR
jgi:hypothetical protein